MDTDKASCYLRQCELILRDYISHKIQCNGHPDFRSCLLENVSSQELSGLDPKITAIITNLACEFERRYRDSYRAQLSDLPADNAICSNSAEAHISFESVASELFQGGWRWARVIALISYVGLLAEATVTSFNRSNCAVNTRLDEIVGWSMRLFESNEARIFFASNNGWNGLKDWYDSSESRNSLSSAPLPQQVAVVGLAAAVMAGLSFMVGRLVA